MDLIGFRGDGGGELEGFLADDVATRKKNVVVAALVGGENDFAAVLVAAAKIFVEDAEVTTVFVAKGAEPGDFSGVEIGRADVDSFRK